MNTRNFRQSFAAIYPVIFFVAVVILSAGSVIAQGNNPGGRYFVEFSGRGLPADLSARISSLGGVLVERVPELKFAIVGNLSESAAASLRQHADVSDVTEDQPLAAAATRRRPVDPSAEGPVLSLINPAMAAFYPLQWNLRAVEADRVWDAGIMGSPEVRVAIIDTGIDPMHPDLAGRIDWSRSISFCDPESAYIAQEFPGYPAWADVSGHGTHAAAIVSSNANIVAGLTSRTTLMAVKWDGIDRRGCGSTSAVLRSIIFATNNGADVINMSLGINAPLPKSGQKGFFHYELLYIRYALQRGVSAVVVSAGNQAEDMDHNGNDFQFLCDIPGVICVSATGPTDSGPNYEGPFVNVDAPAIYTNYGASTIDVAAPGGNLALDETGTTVIGDGPLWSACTTTDREHGPNGGLIPGYCTRTGVLVGPWYGTSFAAPHVSGLAALIVSRIGHGQPAQVRAIIENSSDDLGQPGTDPYYGRGRINVARALGLP